MQLLCGIGAKVGVTKFSPKKSWLQKFSTTEALLGAVVVSTLMTYQLTLKLQLISRLSMNPTQPNGLIVILGLVALLEPTATSIKNASKT
jgi:hypothetical protein